MDSKLKLDELADWWFDLANQKHWFDSSKSNDQLISEKFGYLLEPEYIQLYDQSKNHFTVNQSIGYILLHDQIIRHWARHNNHNYLDLARSSYLKIKDFVKNFYESNKDFISGFKFCFVLLPLRHTNDYFNIRYVLKETWTKLENESNQEIKQIYIRYLKATYERADYFVVNSKPYLEINYNLTNGNMHENIKYYVDKYSNVLDSKSMYNYSPNYKKYNITSCLIANECKQIDKSTNLIVSISGGVDSMVISWVLKKLGYNIILVHINYANRSDTDLEQNMVESWASYLGVKIFYRKLDEINRPKCMQHELRNIYENYTRDQRYSAYIQSAKLMGWKDFKVVLGHNHDDCMENIFTNITSKTKYENLYGMEYFSQVSFKNTKINFVRPMLSIPKSKIYELAIDNNILFLWDSTPKWSQRGKLRDLVRPALNEFNPEIFQGLDTLVNVLKESMDCLDLMISNFSNRIQNNTIKITIKELNSNNVFWDKFLNKIGIEISTKCLKNLNEKITRFKNIFDSKQLNMIEMYQINKNHKMSFKKINLNELELKFY